jgi:hypothetical protein
LRPLRAKRFVSIMRPHPILVVAGIAMLCASPATAQTPLSDSLAAGVSSRLAPQAAVRAVGAALVGDGWDLVASDAPGGLLTARRVQQAKAWRGVLRCRYAKNSIMETHGEITVTASVAALVAPDGRGSVVRVRLPVRIAYPSLNGMMAMAPEDARCRVDGPIEAQVAAALRPSAATAVPADSVRPLR